MNWIKDHVVLLFGLLSGLFLALLGFQKLAKKAASVVDVEAANAEDAATVVTARETRKEALRLASEAHKSAIGAEIDARKLAHTLGTYRTMLAAEVSDEEALKEINRD